MGCRCDVFIVLLSFLQTFSGFKNTFGLEEKSNSTQNFGKRKYTFINCTLDKLVLNESVFNLIL